MCLRSCCTTAFYFCLIYEFHYIASYIHMHTELGSLFIRTWKSVTELIANKQDKRGVLNRKNLFLI